MFMVASPPFPAKIWECVYSMTISQNNDDLGPGTCVSVCRESSTAAAARSGWQLSSGQHGVAALCSNLSICRQWRGGPLSQITDMQGHGTRGIFCFCQDTAYHITIPHHSMPMPSILMAIHENIFQIFKSMFSIYQELHIPSNRWLCVSNRMDIGQAEITQ